MADAALANADLARLLLDFLACAQLLPLAATNRLFAAAVHRIMEQRYLDDGVRYLCYKQLNSRYLNFKQACCYVERMKRRGMDRVMLLGSSFGVPSYRSAVLTLSPTRVGLEDSESFDQHMGCRAVSSTAEGDLFAVGGFDDRSNEATSAVYSCPLDGKSSSALVPDLEVAQSVCFAAATSTIAGDIVLTGGCSNPFQGAEVFRSCRLLCALSSSSSSSLRWDDGAVPDMLNPRCGHELVTLFDGRLMAIGGYLGAHPADGSVNLYHDSAELFDWEKQAWLTVSSVMSHPRSGFASCVGPGGAVYVAGGSTNGERGSSALERYDSREGRWATLAPMHTPRGYTTGCVTFQGYFIVSGGLHGGRVQGGLEGYDFRADKWFVVGDYQPHRQRVPSHLRSMLPLAQWADFPQSQNCAHVPLDPRVAFQFLRAAHRMVLLP